MEMSFFKDKKVLITGHTGFKGSWLSKILLNYGADVLGYSLECVTEPSMFKILGLENQMKSVIGDIRDINKLKETVNEFKPEIIIHLAAVALAGKANTNPVETYEINVMGTVNLLEAIRECDSVKSFVHVSTDTVYKLEEDKQIYNEQDHIEGRNVYSNSKSCAELAVLNYKKLYFKDKDYPRISITRSVNVIGGGDFNESRIVPNCVNSWFSNKDIEIKNPKNKRPFLHVLEALHGYLLLARKQYEDKSVEGIYNFSPEQEEYVWIYQLVNSFCDKLDNKIKWIDKSNGCEINHIFETDSTKARNLLNWENKFNFEARIQSVIDWNKALLNNEDMNSVTSNQIKEYFKQLL